MSAEQLCFFKFSRPLLDLFGQAFFRGAPSLPGVYLFYGERRRVLYVGKSKNLRQRLSYYKNAQPEREPRKIIRLVHQTRQIEWQTCETPEAAEARELELIQEHQPRFNVRHALSRTYSYFGLKPHGRDLALRVTLSDASQDEERIIGAFKNRGLCRRALFAIARTCWAFHYQVANIFAFPLPLLDRTRLNEALLQGGAEFDPELTALFRGEADLFSSRTVAVLERTIDPFVKAVYESDLLTLAEFFDLAQRMKRLRDTSGKERLAQRDLDRVLLAQSHQRLRDRLCGNVLPEMRTGETDAIDRLVSQVPGGTQFVPQGCDA